MASSGSRLRPGTRCSYLGWSDYFFDSTQIAIWAIKSCTTPLDNPAAWNKPARADIEYCVFVTSRWFPPILAFLQTARYLGLVGYDYWAAAQNLKRFNVGEFLRRDLARPLFEPYGFCGGWTHYASGQSAVLGLDLPAYAGATLLYSATNRQAGCVDALTTPRGQIVTAVFVLPLWYLVGLSIRRLAQRRWRRRITGRLSRTMVSTGLISLPFGLLALLFSIVGVFVSEVGLSVRLAGFAFWALYLATLTAEHLRVWPFGSTNSSMRPECDSLIS
jgi:hypothetical protein